MSLLPIDVAISDPKRVTNPLEALEMANYLGLHGRWDLIAAGSILPGLWFELGFVKGYIRAVVEDAGKCAGCRWREVYD